MTAQQYIDSTEALRTIGNVIHNCAGLKQLNGEFNYAHTDAIKALVTAAAVIAERLSTPLEAIEATKGFTTTPTTATPKTDEVPF